MRNDSDVFIKTERKSSIQSSSESIKENKEPENENAKHQKRKSPDEGIQSATESDACSEHGAAKKRSNSVEFITAKAVEIDITSGDDFDKMPPPAVPKKATKKTRTKQKKVVEESEESVAGSIRVTRSKIKEEKLSINMNSILLPETDSTLQSTSEINSTKPNETAVTKKGTKKKYPMPILVKMEKPEEVSKEPSVETNLESPPKENVNTTFNIAMGNETVTLVPAQALNETVTISQGDMHDSLMTEDNDEDSSEEVLLSSLKGKKLPLPPLPALKLKKNEVFK